MNKADKYERFVTKFVKLGLARAPALEILFHLRQPRYYSRIHLDLEISQSSVKQFLTNHPNWYRKQRQEIRDHTKTGRRLHMQYVLSDEGYHIVDYLSS